MVIHGIDKAGNMVPRMVHIGAGQGMGAAIPVVADSNGTPLQSITLDDNFGSEIISDATFR